ncbi:general secretion pathway protein H [Gammaproteobacteria bacterium]
MSKGFTLLEILVVILIIGILSTMVSLSVGSREPATHREARRLAELMRLAAEESILQGQEWGLRLVEDGYEFTVLDGEVWRTALDDILRPRKLPRDLEAKLFLREEELEIDALRKEEEKRKEEDKDEIRPQVLILSSGEVTPFQLTFQSFSQPSWRVLGSFSGVFTVSPLAQKK